MAPLHSATPNNLPANLTSFIGREREIAEICRLVAKARLVTLTGPGGCGKSRLAIEVARSLLCDFPDGVRVVELAPLLDPALLPQAVAAVVGVQEQPGESMVTIVGKALRAKTLLLVLDNFEHLRAACAPVAHVLLQGCAGLRILATSREPLGLAGETIWRVPPLSLPETGRPWSLDKLAGVEAVRLFVERGTAGHSGFQLTPHNVQAVAQVCRRLDGIPRAPLHNLGCAVLRRGDRRRAAALFRESLALARGLGSEIGMICCLAGLAGVCASGSRPEQAAMLFGAVDGLLARRGLHLESPERADFSYHVALVRGKLAEREFAAAAAMSLEDALASALSPEEASEDASSPSARPRGTCRTS